MAMAPNHTEAITRPGSAIASDCRFKDVATINARKGQPLEAQWARRSMMGIEAINSAKAQRQAQQKAARPLDAALATSVMRCCERASRLYQSPAIAGQPATKRLAVFFAELANQARELSVLLANFEDPK